MIEIHKYISEYISRGLYLYGDYEDFFEKDNKMPNCNCQNKEKPKLEIIYLEHYLFDKWGPLKYVHINDSGFDLRAVVYPNLNLNLIPNNPLTINTGVKFKIPKGYELVIRPRSGLSKKGIVPSFGTIDEDYRGEISITLFNLTNFYFVINNGDRIAQCIIQEKRQAELIKVDKFDDITDRNENGFGSSGYK